MHQQTTNTTRPCWLQDRSIAAVGSGGTRCIAAAVVVLHPHNTRCLPTTSSCGVHTSGGHLCS